MKFNVLLTVLSGLNFFSFSAIAAEISVGQNHLVCENKEFGKFELTFVVKNNVVHTEYYKAADAAPVPVWETLETELTNLEFTSGKLLVPSGTKGLLPGATLNVVRYAEAGNPLLGMIQASLSIPESLGFPMGTLLIDYNHPEKYGTNELGAQTFSWNESTMVQLFFRCR